MSSDLYLWTSIVAKISDRNMKMIYEYIYNYLDNFNVDSYYSILKDNRINKKVINKLNKNIFNSSIIATIKKTMKDYGVSYVTYDDEKYPDKLREIYDPPQVLYYYGDINLLNEEPLISVIGSRNCSQYGKNAVKYVVKELSKHNFVTVSGMADGIDSLAHFHSLEYNIKTIAVMGTSIEKTYPSSSYKLRQRIIDEGGLVISEHPIGTESKRYFFALRNRIIAGISDGIVVVEAKNKSGTSITVDCGLQYGKNVYAIPGSIFSELSYGCNKMISEGAKPVSDIEDILIDYQDFIRINEKKYNNILKNSGNYTSNYVNINFDDNNNGYKFSEIEKLIIKILKSEGAQDIDNLSIKIDCSIGDLLLAINSLMMKEFIIEEGINKYALNNLK